MPQFGTGIIPSGQIGTELNYITRRGFVERLIVQIYQASPTIAMLLSNANLASGGVSPVTVPVQGLALTQGGWGDYSGSFPPPQEIAGIYNAEFNMKLLRVPVGMLGMQALVQVDETVIAKIEAAMNDASNQAIQLLSQALFGNFTNAQQIIGLPGAVDNGTNLVTYGGISRTANTWWQSLAFAEGAVAPTNVTVLLDMIKVTAGASGERPTFAVTGPLTWHKLSTSYIPNERYMVMPQGSYADAPGGARSAFSALMVGPMPVYWDPYATEGTIYYLNENYISMYVHQDAFFGFTGFESLIPNGQIGYLGLLLSLMELVNAKPVSCGVATGYTHS